jgi:hypothetical protein
MRHSPYALRLNSALHVLMFVLGLMLVSPPEASGQG